MLSISNVSATIEYLSFSSLSKVERRYPTYGSSSTCSIYTTLVGVVKMSRLCLSAIFGIIIFWFIGNEFGIVFADNFGNFFERMGTTNSFFSTVFSTFYNLAKKIGKTIDAAIEEDCVYRCPSGRR